MSTNVSHSEILEVGVPSRGRRSVRRKKLIEVSLPLDAINKACAREKSIRHGHPSTLHLWWARRPLAAARAIIFAQTVDDPSAHPELFPTVEEQEAERQRLFGLIIQLVQWENSSNAELLAQARSEIMKSWRSTCPINEPYAQGSSLFEPSQLPAFHDPFAGGGALPLEAQRLGFRAYASDLNPIAVLINKAMIEIPSLFRDTAPINAAAREDKSLIGTEYRGARGLASDVEYYGEWMRGEAQRIIGDLYPKVLVTSDMARSRPDLKPLIGEKLTVIAWLWARTVNSPNPAFADTAVPLASTFLLSRMKGNEAYVDPIVTSSGYTFEVRIGAPQNLEEAKRGTKLARGANFRCIMSGAPIDGDYIKAEGKAGRIGAKMMAIVAEGSRGRIYLTPTAEMEAAAGRAVPTWKPELPISGSTQYLGVKPYGMDHFWQIFTPRQLVALSTFSELVKAACNKARQDAAEAGRLADLERNEDDIGYAEAVAIFLAFAVSGLAARLSTCCVWDAGGPTWGTKVNQTFGRQAIPMSWDYAEANPLSSQSGSFANSLEYTVKGIQVAGPVTGVAELVDASTQELSKGKIVSTDPPYYDNIPYADLSDFFYVWLRHSLLEYLPDLFATVATPKAQELVAFAYRHGGKQEAEEFFLDGMTRAMHRLAEQAHPSFPVSIYYAFRQTETDSDGTASTGWETFLEAVIRAGFEITGTWPMRTELSNRMRGMGSNALASSIVLVCQPHRTSTATITRRDFISALRTELPPALAHLQRGNIAPVDLAQAAIGPGMSVFSRYAKVLDAEGKELTVRDALSLINQSLDEVLAEQEGAFDAETRWAIAWFEQCGFGEGEYGLAETLSKAKNTGVDALSRSGTVVAKSGKVRLRKPSELDPAKDHSKDGRANTWQLIHRLINKLETNGEEASARFLSTFGSEIEVARELAYRLYAICERKKRAAEALSYNGLVQSWPELVRLSGEKKGAKPAQTPLFEGG